MGYYNNKYKMNKYETEIGKKNKTEKINGLNEKIINKLDFLKENGAGFTEHSKNEYNNDLAETIYIKNKNGEQLRVSIHQKNNPNYSMINGIIITMRNIKNNNDNKILEIIKDFVKN